MFSKAYIPYKGYYSTPFCRWQGSLQYENSIELGARTAKGWMQDKKIDPAVFDYLYLAITVGQKGIFHGAPWVSHMLGVRLPGTTVMQACASSTASVTTAAMAVETGLFENIFILSTDRTSNGPHTIWPNPFGPGGEVISENWNMDNMRADPACGKSMIEGAECVAKFGGFTKEEADELVLVRYEQYKAALADDRAFQKRYMIPVEAKLSKKKTVLIEADEGIHETTREGLMSLKPQLEGGIHSYGAQTHPADGNTGIIVTGKEKAEELSADKAVHIRFTGAGFYRTERAGFMPAAVPPAAKKALAASGITPSELKVVKNHNPFMVNDLFLGKELGYPAEKINNYGSSMVFGHPQAPTLSRLLIEAIEETVLLGGGYALVCGCAAGDSAGAMVIKVD